MLKHLAVGRCAVFRQLSTQTTTASARGNETTSATQATPASSKFSKTRDAILEKLNKKFGYDLVHADVINKNWKFEKPEDDNTHLQIIVVTTQFESTKNAARVQLISDLLKSDIPSFENVEMKLLAPTKWYDSNQRGLKLPEAYCNPVAFKGPKLDLAYKQYYEYSLKSFEKDAAKQVDKQKKDSEPKINAEEKIQAKTN